MQRKVVPPIKRFLLAGLAGLGLLLPVSAGSGAAGLGTGLTASALAQGLGPTGAALTAHDLATFLYRLGAVRLGTSTPLAAAVKAGLLPPALAGKPARVVTAVQALYALAGGLGVKAPTTAATVSLLQRLGAGPLPSLQQPWTLGIGAQAFAHAFQTDLTVQSLLADQLTGSLPATEKLDGTFVLNLRSTAGLGATSASHLKRSLALAMLGLSLDGVFSIEAQNPSGPARVGMTVHARLGSKRLAYTLIGITAGNMAYVDSTSAGKGTGWRRVPVKNASGVPLAPLLAISTSILAQTHMHLIGRSAGLDQVGFSTRLASTSSLLGALASGLGTKAPTGIGALPPVDLWGFAALDPTTGRILKAHVWAALPSDPGLGLEITSTARYGVPVTITVPPAARSAPLAKGSPLSLLP